MLKHLFYGLLYLSGVSGWWFSDGPKWDGLKATWGPNPLSSSYFVHQPRTIQDAKDQGFVEMNGCSYNGNFTGIRYIRRVDRDTGDYGLMLLYDINGYIAGIQTSVPKSLGSYPKTSLQPPFVADGNRWVLTAYFSDPSKICTSGRSATDFAKDGTGNQLYIQNGTRHTDVIDMPMLESAVPGTKWVQGKCFLTMGNHYWYDARVDTNCDSMFPVFLLYNGGELNAFGWAMPADLKSKHLEHPDKSTFGLFMKVIPSCLQDGRIISTMHIYMTYTAATDLC